jgi:hypothetical protein
VACDKYRNEVWVNFNDYAGAGFTKTWIWNVDSNTFVTQSAQTTVAAGYVAGLRSMVVGGSTDKLHKYSTTTWMAPTVVFNSVCADDPGTLKQWVDVTMFLETLTGTLTITPQFEGVSYGASYTIAANSGAFDHVVAPLLNAVHSKHMRFGFATGGTPPNFKLKGLTYRYRQASETLRN